MVTGCAAGGAGPTSESVARTSLATARVAVAPSGAVARPTAPDPGRADGAGSRGPGPGQPRGAAELRGGRPGPAPRQPAAGSAARACSAIVEEPRSAASRGLGDRRSRASEPEIPTAEVTATAIAFNAAGDDNPSTCRLERPILWRQEETGDGRASGEVRERGASDLCTDHQHVAIPVAFPQYLSLDSTSVM
jgi:hypothetical protein